MNILDFLFRRNKAKEDQIKKAPDITVVKARAAEKQNGQVAKSNAAAASKGSKKRKNKQKNKYGSSPEAEFAKAVFNDFFTQRNAHLTPIELQNVLDCAGVYSKQDQQKMTHYLSNLGMLTNNRGRSGVDVSGNYGQRKPRNSISKARGIALFYMKQRGLDYTVYHSPESIREMQVLVDAKGNVMTESPKSDTGNLMSTVAKPVMISEQGQHAEEIVAYEDLPPGVEKDLQVEGQQVYLMSLGDYEKTLNAPFDVVERPTFSPTALYEPKVIESILAIKRKDMPFEDMRQSIISEVKKLTGETMNDALSLKVMRNDPPKWMVTLGTWRKGIQNYIGLNGFMDVMNELRYSSHINNSNREWASNDMADAISKLDGCGEVVEHLSKEMIADSAIVEKLAERGVVVSQPNRDKIEDSLESRIRLSR